MVEIYQQISKKLPKLAVITATAALSFTVIDAKPVKAELVWWDMEFFDNTGGQVGSGEFSYDLDTTTFIVTLPYPVDPLNDPLCQGNLDSCGFYVDTALESFSANILGVQFGKQLTAWWNSNTVPPMGHLYGGRAGRGVGSGWFFGDDLGNKQFSISRNGITSSTGNGSWLLAGSEIPQPGFYSGNWTATLRNSTSVPEPTVTLSLFGFAILGLASLKKHKQQ